MTKSLRWRPICKHSTAFQRIAWRGYLGPLQDQDRPATLASLIAKKADSLRIFADRVRELLSGVAVKHLDETGFRIAGKTRWLHMLCSTSLSHLRLGTGRGDIPSGLAGTIIHDCWPPYLALEAVEHGLCNAHLLRELQAIMITTRNLGRRI